MVKWIRYWTQDQQVWVQFPVLAMYREKCRASFLFHAASVNPTIYNGYLVHTFKVGSIVAGCTGALPCQGNGEMKNICTVMCVFCLDSKEIPLPFTCHLIVTNKDDKSYTAATTCHTNMCEVALKSSACITENT